MSIVRALKGVITLTSRVYLYNAAATKKKRVVAWVKPGELDMISLYYSKLLLYNFNGVFAVTESNEADGAGSGHVEGTAEGKLWKS